MSISINKKYSFEISINSPTILVRNHSQLDQLDYESSGHTGFASSDEFSSHIENTNNPHSVTKTQVGLENVEDGAQINIIEKVNIDGVDLTPDVDKRITLPNKEPAFEKNTAFNKNFGNENDTVCEGNDVRLSDARTPLSHTHDDRYYTESEIDTALGLKVDKVEGETLTPNKYTNDEKSKLSGIEPNAEVNTLEVIKVEGESDLVITDKKSTIPLATDTISGALDKVDKAYIDNVRNGTQSIPYDNTTSGLDSTTLDTAIDELNNIKLNNRIPVNRLIYRDINNNHTFINPSRIEYLSRVAYFKVKEGRFKCKYTNASGRKWSFPSGTVLNGTSTPISTSTDEIVDVTITVPNGYVALYSNNWVGSYELDASSSDSIAGSLADLPALTNYLSLSNCPSITGDLKDLPPLTYLLSLNACKLLKGSLKDLPPLTTTLSLSGCLLISGSLGDLPRVTYSLNLYGCALITGSLSDLPALTNTLDLGNCSLITGSLSDLPALTNYLSLGNCSLITGSLSDLPALTNYLSLYNCSLITGAYTAVTSNSVPTETVLTGTGLSATDMDNTLIAYAATTKNGGSFTATNKNRTSASDSAVETLVSRGWTINGLVKI